MGLLHRLVSTFLAVCAIIGLTDMAVMGKAEPIPARRCACVPILDPGHGGADGGAVAPDGTEEADLNLAVALRLEMVFRLFGIAPVMTRTTREIDYPAECRTIRQKKVYDQKSRLALVSEVPGGVLISIHQNIFSASSAHGAQVLYAPNGESRALAEQLQAALASGADRTGGKAAAPITRDIILINSAPCPAVLTECGFLSNPSELSLLQDPDYQLRLAGSIFAGFLAWTRISPDENGGTNESQDDLLLYRMRQ